jgi:hypothetical protein
MLVKTAHTPHKQRIDLRSHNKVNFSTLLIVNERGVTALHVLASRVRVSTIRSRADRGRWIMADHCPGQSTPYNSHLSTIPSLTHRPLAPRPIMAIKIYGVSNSRILLPTFSNESRRQRSWLMCNGWLSFVRSLESDTRLYQTIKRPKVHSVISRCSS